MGALKEAADGRAFEKVVDEWVGCWVVCKVEDREDVWHGMQSWAGKGSEMWELFTEGLKVIEREMFEMERFADFRGVLGVECGNECAGDGWQQMMTGGGSRW